MTFSRILRDSLFEADPMAAGEQVDFEQRDADRSRYTIGHNIHPASEMEDQSGDDGSGAPYDGAMMGGGMPGGADMGAGGMPPGGMPGTDQLQPIQPGMGIPGQEDQQQQPQMPMESHDDFDLYLDALLDESTEELSEGPWDFIRGGTPGGGYRGGYPAQQYGGGYQALGPQNYAGFSGPQQPPASVVAGGPAAVQNWQTQMQAVGRGVSNPMRSGIGTEPPTFGSRGQVTGRYADPKLQQQQTDLINKGYDLGPTGADGRMGRYTKAAMAKAQQNGPANGIIPNTAGPGVGDRDKDLTRTKGTMNGAGPMSDEEYSRQRMNAPGATVGDARKSLTGAGNKAGSTGANIGGPDADTVAGLYGASIGAARSGGPIPRPDGVVPNATNAAAGARTGSFDDRVERRLANTGQTGANRPGWAGSEPAASGGAPGGGSFDDRVERRLANTGQTGANRPGWAGEVPGGAANAAATAAEEPGWLSRAGSAVKGAAGTAARVAGRALPPIAGGIAAYNDYQKNGSFGHAAATGLGTAVGGAVGGGIGAATGGAVGSAVPVIGNAAGALTGGAAGGYYGAETGGQLAGDAYNWATGNNNKPSATGTGSGAPGVGAAGSGSSVVKTPPTNNNPPVRGSNGLMQDQPPRATVTGAGAGPGQQSQPSVQPAIPSNGPAAPQARGGTGLMQDQPPRATITGAGAGSPTNTPAQIAKVANDPTPPSTKTEQKDWKLNWGDYNILHESDRSQERKRRGY